MIKLKTKREWRMSYLLYNQLNVLEPFSFIGGTEYYLDYTIYDDDGITPIDIAAGSAKLIVFRYGYPNVIVIERAGVLSATTGRFDVTLQKTDTISLSGKFIQQPVYVDFYGKEFRLGQGEFIIGAAGQ